MTLLLPRPCSVPQAIFNMLKLVGVDVAYTLGTEWDCAGVVVKALELARHRQGFARGNLPPEWARFADVVDDINTNSMIKDAALPTHDVFRFVQTTEPLLPGDLLAYPTIYTHNPAASKFIGHVQMVLAPNGATGAGPWAGVQIAHSHGPDGRRPAVTIGYADVMDKHNAQWQQVWSKAWALRVITV